MKHFLLITLLSLPLLQCAWRISPEFTPLPDQDAINRTARTDFLKKPVVVDFLNSGFVMDCELSICRQITDEALQVLLKFKAPFIGKFDRIKKIILTKEDYPLFDHRLDGAYLPANLSDSLLSEFFEVLDSLRDFESREGVRLEFPNNRTLRSSIFPLLQILKDNLPLIRTEAHRLKLIEISSVYNRFHPGKGLLQLRIQNLKRSFSDLWSFMKLLFEAQDLYGSVQFDLDYGHAESASAMTSLLKNKDLFSPLLSRLQGRAFRFLSWNYYGYADAHGLLWDLGISSSFDEKYLAEVFRDQIRVVEISAYVGVRINHLDRIIDLRGHADCLEKIESLKLKLKEKVGALKDLVVVSNGYAPGMASSFADGKLVLNCDQTADDMSVAIGRVNGP